MNVVIEYLCEAAEGESRSGDAVVVRQEDDRKLVAVIDSLGHGERAADVADTAVAHLRDVPLANDADEIMRSLHDALHGTRGAAATICLLNGVQVGGCGVGNVEFRAQRSDIPGFLNPGILGQNVRQMRAFRGEVRPGSRLVLFSDGISAHARFDEVGHLSAAEACRTLFQRYRKAYDDGSLAIIDVSPEARVGRPGSLA